MLVKRKMGTRWEEHNSSTHDFEPAKHLNEDIQHSCKWKILANDSKNARTRKNLETIYIVLLRLLGFEDLNASFNLD